MSANKFRAKKDTRVIGDNVYDFDSKAEAAHFDYLMKMYMSGGLDSLTLQPEFELAKGFEIDCDFTKQRFTKMSRMVYTGDFKYLKNGLVIVDEVKGVATEAYRIRLKLFLSQGSLIHGVDVFREIINGKASTYYLNRKGMK